jgi:hypothetical protein
MSRCICLSEEFADWEQTERSLGDRFWRSGGYGAIDASSLCEVKRQKKGNYGREGDLQSGHEAQDAVRAIAVKIG